MTAVGITVIASLPDGQSVATELTLCEVRVETDYDSRDEEALFRVPPLYHPEYPMRWALEGTPIVPRDGAWLTQRTGRNVVLDVDDLRTQTELATELGVGQSTVSMWHQRRDKNGFPSPVIQRGPRVKLWSLAAVKAWVAA